jgi:hypothetical protein
MIPRPAATEAESSYFRYINLVTGDDPLAALEKQLNEPLLSTISEEKSLHRYAPDKWSIRQVLNHVTDTERAFTYRMLWFARGFDAPLESYDQTVAAAGAGADRISWAAHVEEFQRVRLATISLFRNMPAEGWTRSGIVDGNRVTVRALAYITPGHFGHHVAVVRERYL